jgi:hypothetical protein
MAMNAWLFGPYAFIGPPLETIRRIAIRARALLRLIIESVDRFG